MKRIFLACMMIAITASMARAEAAAKCGDKAKDGRCMDNLVAAEQAKMEDIWSRVLAIAEGETARLLQAEQDAWLKFQDAACGFYADAQAFGDEVRAEEQPQCKARTLAARSAELKAYLRVIDP